MTAKQLFSRITGIDHQPRKTSRRTRSRRPLRLERLEARELMAADAFSSPYALDITGDGQVTPQDALVLINELNTRGAYAVSEPGDPYDVNFDQYVSAVDALLIINEVNQRSSEFNAVANAEAVTIMADAASTRLYLKLPGVNGDVTTAGYQGWIEAKSYWNDAQKQPGKSPTLYGDVHVVTATGQVLPAITKLQLDGNVLANAELHVVQQLSNSKWVTTAKTVLTDTIVSTTDLAGRSGVEPAAGFTLSYGTISNTYYRVDPATGKLSVSGAEKLDLNATNAGRIPVGSGVATSYDELQSVVADEGQVSQSRILFRMDGLTGDVTTKDAKGWIEIQSFGQQFELDLIDPADRTRGTRSAERLELDVPGNYPLLQFLGTGARVGELRVERFVNGSWTPIHRWSLTKFAVTAARSSGKPGALPATHLELHLASFQLDSSILDPKTQKVVGTSSMSWSGKT